MSFRHIVGLVVGAAGIFSAPQSAASAEEVASPLSAPWVTCLKEKAASLAKGPDSADIVAKGVELACSTERDALIDAMRRDRFPDQDRWVLHKAMMIQSLREAGQKIAVQNVLEVRASATR